MQGHAVSASNGADRPYSEGAEAADDEDLEAAEGAAVGGRKERAKNLLIAVVTKDGSIDVIEADTQANLAKALEALGGYEKLQVYRGHPLQVKEKKTYSFR